MAESKSELHDSYDENGYKKRCFCQKCTEQYVLWCKKNKKDGVTHCKRRCRTVCDIKCVKPVTTVYKWEEQQRFEGKWESYKELPVPKDCPSCKQAPKNCKCGKKHDKKSLD